MTTSKTRLLRRSLLAAPLAAALLAASALYGQDAVRPSLAGESAAQARSIDVAHIPYNLMAGPVRFRFSATMGIEFNDNINYSDTDRESDIILRPQIGVNALWPITQLNTLKLDLGLGYAFYLDHSGSNTNSILIAPRSQIAFDVFVGDFKINVHDRFSLEQDPIGEGAISNTVDYGRFENTAGVSVLWDLNKAVVTLGYDHYNFISTTSQFDYLNRNAEELSASVSVAATSTTSAGLEGSFVSNRYDQHILNDSNTYSGGAFVETQISNYVKLRVAGGYQAISFDRGGFVMDTHDLHDFYANALLSHRVNAFLTHSLSVGHEATLGVNSNYIQLNYIRHTATWNIINKTLLSTELFYEDADESGGSVLPFEAEHFHRYGGALSVGYQLTKHVTLGARYQYTQKDSDRDFRDYRQNRVSIDGTYSF